MPSGTREGNPTAKAHDLDTIGDFENVRHIVTNEYDWQSTITNYADQIETRELPMRRLARP